jgi:hypothetical protein
MGPFLAFWLLMVALVATAVVEHTAHSVLEERQRFEVWQRRISQETEWIEGRP